MELQLVGQPGLRYLTWDVASPAPSFVATSFKENLTRGSIRCDESGIRLQSQDLHLAHAFPTDSDLYRHGWSSWSATAWWSLNREPWRVWDNTERTQTAEDVATDSASVHRSYLVTALEADGECLLVGALAHTSAVFDVDTSKIYGRSIHALCALEGEGDESSPVLMEWFIAVGDERRCWESYSRALSEYIGARKRRRALPTWSSWYSWFEEITEDIIIQEIPEAAKLGYQVVQIDDGWERAVGQWEANDDFPSGMEALAASIQKAGMTAGLWIAPFIATANTPVVRNHPEYFIHDEEGNPLPVGFNWGQHYYGLDCTHPGAQQWLREVIARVTAWGYRHLKLDFIYAAAFEGYRYVNIPREEAYRMGVEIIREAALESYLLGSGAVMAASLDLLDGVRGGPDTAPYWDNGDRHRDPTGPGVRNALRSSLNRQWLSDVIDIDPDVALLRTHGSLLSPEANMMTVECARACHVFSCSDPGSWLTSEQWELLTAITREFRAQTPGHSVVQCGRYSFSIDDRIVDFEPWINPVGRMSDRLLVK